MNVIAKNTEDYISFSIKVEVDEYIDKNYNERTKEMELRFIDSIKFMSSSLDSLVNNLGRGVMNLGGLSPTTTANSSCSFEKESTHTDTWIAGIHLTLFWTESGRTLYWTGGKKAPMLTLPFSV